MSETSKKLLTEEEIQAFQQNIRNVISEHKTMVMTVGEEYAYSISDQQHRDFEFIQFQSPTAMAAETMRFGDVTVFSKETLTAYESKTFVTAKDENKSSRYMYVEITDPEIILALEQRYAYGWSVYRSLASIKRVYLVILGNEHNQLPCDQPNVSSKEVIYGFLEGYIRIPDHRNQIPVTLDPELQKAMQADAELIKKHFSSK